MLSVPRINALKWTFPRDASTLGYPVALPLLTHPTHNMLFLFFFLRVNGTNLFLIQWWFLYSCDWVKANRRRSPVLSTEGMQLVHNAETSPWSQGKGDLAQSAKKSSTGNGPSGMDFMPGPKYRTRSWVSSNNQIIFLLLTLFVALKDHAIEAKGTSIFPWRTKMQRW